ncbi:MAG: NUDIX domain-containing protein [Micromonosporaceae bacterium]|nr:NUDIX domain-containing protein [Micromonosporaceae bacterium]
MLLARQRQGHRLWSLPGGAVRPGESPVDALIRDLRTDTGLEIQIMDLVGLYHLTGDACGEGVPDLVVHVFRALVIAGEAAVNAPGRIARLTWSDPKALPEPLTATARIAITDALSGHSGVVRDVERDCEPEIPEAV